jgi:hypothetical protein
MRKALSRAGSEEGTPWSTPDSPLAARSSRLLDEEIPELLTQLVRITGGDRVHDLVGLLEKVGSEGMERLLPVPRTPPRVAQMVHDGDETIKC